MLQEMYADLLVKGLSPTTVRKVHRVLSSAFKYAVGIDAIYRNPAQAVRPPKLVRREMQVLTASQTRRMLAACEDNPWGAVFHLAVETGMRPEEYLALKWEEG